MVSWWNTVQLLHAPHKHNHLLADGKHLLYSYRKSLIIKQNILKNPAIKHVSIAT